MQAAGSVLAYPGRHHAAVGHHGRQVPQGAFDFFPLTVDVEERMYAAGRIPGSFFRREGRPSEDADPHLPADRPPAAPDVHKGLRNEVQVVITVLALDPDHPYDVARDQRRLGVHQLSGLPFSGPVGATRVALIDGQWVGFPTHGELEGAISTWSSPAGPARRRRRDHDGRGRGHRADDRADRRRRRRPTEEVVAAGPRGRQAVHRGAVRGPGGAGREAAKPVADFPLFLDYQDDVYDAVRPPSATS